MTNKNTLTENDLNAWDAHVIREYMNDPYIPTNYPSRALKKLSAYIHLVADLAISTAKEESK